MIPELGRLALITALVIAAVQATLPLLGATRNDARWMRLARPAAQAQFALVATAFACLVQAFVVGDWSVAIVVTHSNAQLPLHFRVAAAWGAHEGSLLLWVLMLAGWTAAVSCSGRDLPDRVIARVLGVLGLVSVGFLLFLLLTSDPFARLVPAALEGRDLNPVLQDWGMLIHPPMLYMGYVGFAVAFAFAMSALLGDLHGDGSDDAAWARASRPWALAAWCFLTVGIALGSWWAYRVLGWGGWWFWDPVENASFIPWLVGTALVHSLAVTDRRGAFGAWTVFLAIGTFSLSLLGTFLVRSGVLNSVHTFANDPKRGAFMLGLFALVVGASLALFAWRAPRIARRIRFDALSRETLLLANNVLLVVAAATVLLGTLYPLVLEALGFGKISVGTPYFETVFVPLVVPLALLIGVGPLASWKTARLGDLSRLLKRSLLLATALALCLPVLSGRWSGGVAFGLFLSLWIGVSTIAGLLDRLDRHARGIAALRTQSRAYYGMLAAHLGLAVFIAGVTLVKGYEVERDVSMRVGDSIALDDHLFRFVAADRIVGPNYTATRGTIEVLRDGVLLDTLHPEKRLFNFQRATTTEAAIRRRPFGDLYVALGEPLADGAWSLRLYAKPFIGWVWGGCLLMALGGALAATDRRHRQTRPLPTSLAAQPA